MQIPFSSTLFRYCAELCHSRSFRLIPVTCPCFAIPFQRRAKLVKAFSSHTQQRPSVTLLIRGLSVLFPNKASLNYSDTEPCFSNTGLNISYLLLCHPYQCHPVPTRIKAIPYQRYTSAHHCFPGTILCCSEAWAKRHFACTGQFIAILRYAYALAFNATQLHDISVRFRRNPYRCPRLSAQFHRIDNHRSSLASLFLANALLNRTFSKLR